MTAEIIPFDFEEQAVRVIMRGDAPWFVANDVCRVLEIGNPRDALTRLDDDERDCVGITDAIGRERETNIINESGLYALVLTSRKEQAKRFRKWVTAEVLPAIRRTGRYTHPALAAQESDGEIAGMPVREAELWLQMVREARLSRGTRAAVAIWDRSPLPQIGGVARPDPRDPGQGYACLRHIMDAAWELVKEARAGGVLAAQALAHKGLRAREEGLFVANFALPVFDGTHWQNGRHRDALLGIPGVQPYAGVLSLARTSTRGLIVPWEAFSEAVEQGVFAA